MMQQSLLVGLSGMALLGPCLAQFNEYTSPFRPFQLLFSTDDSLSQSVPDSMGRNVYKAATEQQLYDCLSADFPTFLDLNIFTAIKSPKPYLYQDQTQIAVYGFAAFDREFTEDEELQNRLLECFVGADADSYIQLLQQEGWTNVADVQVMGIDGSMYEEIEDKNDSSNEIEAMPEEVVDGSMLEETENKNDSSNETEATPEEANDGSVNEETDDKNDSSNETEATPEEAVDGSMSEETEDKNDSLNETEATPEEAVDGSMSEEIEDKNDSSNEIDATPDESDASTYDESEETVTEEDEVNDKSQAHLDEEDAGSDSGVVVAPAVYAATEAGDDSGAWDKTADFFKSTWGIVAAVAVGTVLLLGTVMGARLRQSRKMEEEIRIATLSELERQAPPEHLFDDESAADVVEISVKKPPPRDSSGVEVFYDQPSTCRWPWR